MKLAVLFGSFNPLTNAHVTALHTAVRAIGADKGLFVATNGKYLKRKTVKIDDPFYLSEDERKAIIDKVCENEPSLEFACFELGGINPSRNCRNCEESNCNEEIMTMNNRGVAMCFAHGDTSVLFGYPCLTKKDRCNLAIDRSFCFIFLSKCLFWLRRVPRLLLFCSNGKSNRCFQNRRRRQFH